MSSPTQPSDDPKRGRRLVAAVIGVCVLGGALFLALRRPAPSAAALPEVRRPQLEQRAGSWYVLGQSNTFTGYLLDTYDDGSPKSRSTVSNGLLQGLSLGFHTNGQKQVEEYFAAGTSHGVRLKWHANGQKLSEANIVQGKLHGTYRRWDEQGILAEEIEMRDGQPDGVSRAYYPSGFVKAEARLRAGDLLERHDWKDGEHPATAGRTNSSKSL